MNLPAVTSPPCPAQQVPPRLQQVVQEGQETGVRLRHTPPQARPLGSQELKPALRQSMGASGGLEGH